MSEFAHILSKTPKIWRKKINEERTHINALELIQKRRLFN